MTQLEAIIRRAASNSMMKLSLAALLLPALAGAAILPDAIGPFHKGAAAPVALADKPVWDEYGLKESESAAYRDGARKFTAAAYQLQDSTAALAAFDWQRNAGAMPSKVTALAAETAGSLLFVKGNYLLSFDGYKPSLVELDAVLAGLRNADVTPFPVLPGFLPREGLVANSERYVTGPAALQKFYPGIPASVAAFHLGAEAQLGTFKTPKGDMVLAIFNYPTHQIAMAKVEEFQKLNAAVAKRSGPLVAVILAPPDADAAENVLAHVRYQASITASEYVPTRRDNIANLVLNAFTLIGILLAFALVTGLFMGGFRALAQRFRKGPAPDAMITLGLSGR
jgi:hypothetical protein